MIQTIDRKMQSWYNIRKEVNAHGYCFDLGSPHRNGLESFQKRQVNLSSCFPVAFMEIQIKGGEAMQTALVIFIAIFFGVAIFMWINNIDR